MGLQRTRPSHEILSGDSADVYFARARPSSRRRRSIRSSRWRCSLAGGRPVRHRRGQEPARSRPRRMRSGETQVEALSDGDPDRRPRRSSCDPGAYRRFGLYETAFLGMLAQSTGWATAARESSTSRPRSRSSASGAARPPRHHRCARLRGHRRRLCRRVDAGRGAAGRPGADRDDAALARPDLRGHRRGGTGVRPPPGAGRATDRAGRYVQGRGRGGLRVAHALGDRLYGIRLDTPSERGRVTADLVTELRARLDQEGYQHVKIVVSGGLDPDAIRYFKEAGAPVDSYAVGSYISGATPIDFTGDIKEIDGRAIAKRGRIPGITLLASSPAGRPVDLPAAVADAVPG